MEDLANQLVYDCEATSSARPRQLALRTLILENTVADIPHLSTELDRLRSALGSEAMAMMQRHEAEGTLDHPEYQAAVTLLNYRHVCRLAEWPTPLRRSLDDWNKGP